MHPPAAEPLHDAGDRVRGEGLAEGVDEGDRRDAMVNRLSHRGHLSVGDHETEALPVRFLSKESARDPEVLGVLPVPPPHRADLPPFVEPLRRRRKGHRVEPARDREVEGGGAREEE